MCNIVLSILLAGAGAATGQECPDGHGSYGSYGTYGGFGRYGGYGNQPIFMLPPHCFPFPAAAAFPTAATTSITPTTSIAQANKEREILEKRYADLKDLLGKVEERLQGMENKVGTVEILLQATQVDAANKLKAHEGQTADALKNLQQTQVDAANKLKVHEGQTADALKNLQQTQVDAANKLKTHEGQTADALKNLQQAQVAAANQLKVHEGQTADAFKSLQTGLLEILDKNQAKLLADIEERIRALDAKQQSVVATVENQSKASQSDTENRIKGLELKQSDLIILMERNQAQKVAGVEGRMDDRLKLIEEKIRTMNGSEQAKLLATIMEEKLGLGVLRLEDRLKQIEAKLLGKVEPTAPTGPDPLAELARLLDQKLALLEQQLKAKYDPLAEKLKIHEGKVIEEKIKQGFDRIDQKIEQKFVKVEINSIVRETDPKGAKTGVAFNRALIYVSLPSDAKLYIDGHPTAVGTNLRSFVTPELAVNKNYYYTLRVEMERDGKTLTETQRVYFQAGREVRVSFEHVPGGQALEQKAQK